MDIISTSVLCISCSVIDFFGQMMSCPGLPLYRWELILNVAGSSLHCNGSFPNLLEILSEQ